VAFFMIRAAPGGPFDSRKGAAPEIEANLRAAYHLDEPLVQQFGRYVWNLARGDFGPSFQYKDYSVTELIAAGFPVSLRLGGSAMLLALLVGVFAGTHRGPAAELAHRPRRHGGLDDGHLDPELRHGAAADPVFRGVPRLAAGRRLGDGGLRT
jgi:ABC-type microcin C transport system permease subunit YejB